ncbi:MAG: hypothetical protein OEZ02_07545 [Anaerolineae bacterium]|nr:hypothetical protein [Anaerolineae bacterium]
MNSHTLKYPKSHQISLGLGALLLIVFAIYTVSDDMLMALASSAFGIVLAAASISETTTIEYGEQEVTIRGLFRQEQSFRWSDIESVRPKALGGGLRLLDNGENKLLNLDTNMVGAEHFIGKLGDQRAHLFRSTLGENIVQNPVFMLASTVIIMGFGLVFLFVMGPNYGFLGTGIGIALLAAGIVFLGGSTREIRFEKDRLVTKSLVKTREFKVDDLKAIVLKLFVASRGQREYQVILAPKEGKARPIQIMGYNKFMLYLQLRVWFKAVSGEAGIA